jgi:hypothetical protein
MPPRRKPLDATDVAADLARLAGLGPSPNAGTGPPPIVACAYGSLSDLPPPERRHKDETPEQRRAALEARTRLAMAAGVDPAAIARAAAPPPGRKTRLPGSYSPMHETCFPAHTPTFTVDEPAPPKAGHAPFFEYVVEWLAATGHLVVFVNANQICVYPTTASPAHMHALDGAPRYEEGGREWDGLPPWLKEVGWAVGGATVGYETYENALLPKRGSTHSAKFGSVEGNAIVWPGKLCATAGTRNQLRLSSPHFRAAYQRFVERTTARNSRNFTQHDGCGDVVITITFHVDLCQYPTTVHSDQNHYLLSGEDIEFELVDEIGSSGYDRMLYDEGRANRTTSITCSRLYINFRKRRETRDFTIRHRIHTATTRHSHCIKAMPLV